MKFQSDKGKIAPIVWKLAEWDKFSFSVFAGKYRRRTSLAKNRQIRRRTRFRADIDRFGSLNGRKRQNPLFSPTQNHQQEYQFISDRLHLVWHQSEVKWPRYDRFPYYHSLVRNCQIWRRQFQLKLPDNKMARASVRMRVRVMVMVSVRIRVRIRDN